MQLSTRSRPTWWNQRWKNNKKYITVMSRVARDLYRYFTSLQYQQLQSKSNPMATIGWLHFYSPIMIITRTYCITKILTPLKFWSFYERFIFVTKSCHNKGREKKHKEKIILFFLFFYIKIMRENKTCKSILEINKEKLDDKLWVIGKEFYLKKNFSIITISREMC